MAEQPSPDNPEDAWYYEAVQEATNEHAYVRDAETGVIETWAEILTSRDRKAIETEWVANERGAWMRIQAP